MGAKHPCNIVGFSASVVVNEILPTYYASGSNIGNFVIKGMYLDMVPSDALGVFSDENWAPLKYKDTTNRDFLFDIFVEGSSDLVAVPKTQHTVEYSGYLGAIVSSDRSVVYWVNNTHPVH